MTRGNNHPFLRRILLCEISAFLLAGKLLGQLMDPETRWFLFYGWVDFAVVMALLFGCGLAAAEFLHLIARASRGRSDRWLSPWFFFLAIQISFNFSFTLWDWVLAHIPQWSPWLQISIWSVGLALTAGGYAFPAMRGWATKGWRTLAFLWPLLFLVPLNLALAKKWENVSGDPCRLGFRSEGKGAPIVIFILDMVGYDNAFTGVGQIRNKLPHLKAFSEEATVFHQAQAAGGYTHISLPSLMLQDDVSEFLISPTGTTRWGLQNNSDAPLRPAGDFPRALPYRVRASGSRAFYFGYAFPYKQMMPGAWDEAYILPFYAVSLPKPTSRWASLLIQYWLRYVRVSKDPFAALVRARGLHLVLENQHWRAITQDIYSTSMQFIREALSPGDLLIVHCPIPHEPFVFAADGRPSQLPRDDVVGGYKAQLQYADQLLGDWIMALKQTGKWDHSWVLVTSDHGIHQRDYGAHPEMKRHVPLLVKAPGQTSREDRRDPLRLVELDRIPGFSRAVDKKP